MPTFTFTANATTNELTTSANHGLVTGDGPVRVRNVGGALPAPLAAVTDYWVILVDPDQLKLATSSANAMSGTAIDLTDAGTGTHTLEVGLPYARARTYAALSQLRSADLNAIQDSLVALHGLFTGQAQSTFTTGGLVRNEVVSATLGAQQDNYNPAGWNECGLLRITSSAAFTITGFQAPAGNKPVEFTIVLVSGAFTVTFGHENASSIAANRIILAGDGSGGVLDTAGCAATFKYDPTSARWRLISKYRT